MMRRVYVGTSGWAYPSWKPGFYPAKVSAAKFLNYFSTRLNSVEVNYTFRKLPGEKLIQSWIDATPPDFKFAVKAHFRITHSRRLRDASDATRAFFASIEPLRDSGKLGPVLFQLPPNLKLGLPPLKDFLAGLPPGFRAAFEFRNTSWFNDEVFSVLRKANVALCVAESDEIETPSVSTADFSYVRLRKDKYSPAARKQIAERVTVLARCGDVFAYFKHSETPKGARYARALLKEFGGD